MTSLPTCSVGICTLGRPESLMRTVHEVLRQDRDAILEVLVLDQTPDADLADAEQKQLENLNGEKKVRYIRREKPGLTAARNQVLSIANGQVVLFLDDDVLLPPGFIEAHLRVFQEHPRVVGLAGPVHHSRGTVPISELSVEKPGHGTGEHFTGRNPGCFVEDWREIMVGCNHSVLRESAIRAGGYEEHIVGGYYEDSEMTARLRKSGQGTIAFSPDCWLVHLRVPSGGCRIPGNRYHREAEKFYGHCLYFFRHADGKRRLKLFKTTLRAGPFRKENVLDPRRWLLAWTGWFAAWRYAWRKRKTVKSPFMKLEGGAHV